MITRRSDREPDAWLLFRAILADTTAKHWRTLRRIAPTADPRCVAAEAVATQACQLVQSRLLWEALHHLETGGSVDGLVERDGAITAPELRQLGRELEALDHAVMAWANGAYGPGNASDRPTSANDP